MAICHARASSMTNIRYEHTGPRFRGDDGSGAEVPSARTLTMDCAWSVRS